MLEPHLFNSPVAPWYWRSLPLENRSGSEIFTTLFISDDIATLLESPATPKHEYLPHSRYSICAGNPRQQDGKLMLWIPPRGEIFPFLQALCDRSLKPENADYCSNVEPEPHLPFHGGWLGWLGYGVGWEIEQLPQLNRDPLPFPDAYWYEPKNFAILDHHKQVLWLATSSPDTLDIFENQLKDRVSVSALSKDDPNSFIEFATNRDAYMQMVERAKAYIRQGDIFQTNLSFRFSTQVASDPWMIYQHLQAINPSPFANFWKTPWGGLISCSPERLVHLAGRQAQTRPIAGTRPRDSQVSQNQRWEAELRSNPKENAEHIMLVDLERNDLGRVCEWGSVTVDELCVIETYSHVIHLVSNVVGTLNPSKTPVDLIKAVFPGGTITGCPKVRCMEIIEELEPTQRNLFYGSCGYLDHRGNMDLNILIRTLLYSNPHKSLDSLAQDSEKILGLRTVWGQVGAGIVADSQPEREWQESIRKAMALFAVL